MVDRIQWLAQSFGISFQRLADFFRVSPEFIQKVAKGQRNLHPSDHQFLNDPLFSPYPIAEAMAGLQSPIWQDTDKEMRMLEMELHCKKLQQAISKQSAAIEKFKKQHQQLHAILYHARNLPFTSTDSETLVELWWIVTKAKARAALRHYTLAELRQKELKITLLQVELKLLENWMAQDLV